MAFQKSEEMHRTATRGGLSREAFQELYAALKHCTDKVSIACGHLDLVLFANVFLVMICSLQQVFLCFRSVSFMTVLAFNFGTVLISFIQKKFVPFWFASCQDAADVSDADLDTALALARRIAG